MRVVAVEVEGDNVRELNGHALHLCVDARIFQPAVGVICACAPDIGGQRLRDVFLPHPSEDLFHQRNGFFHTLGVTCFVPYIPDQNAFVIPVGTCHLSYVGFYDRFHFWFIGDVVADGIAVLCIAVKRSHCGAAEVARYRLRLRTENRICVFGFCDAAVVEECRHHGHVVTVEQSKQLLKIFHKCVMLYAPEIERHKEADAVESQAGGECNFLCGIAECVFMVVFLQKPHGAVHSSAWDEVKAGDPRLLFVPRPDLVLGPFSFHGRFLLLLRQASPIFPFGEVRLACINSFYKLLQRIAAGL